jgi:hypothetical protein
MHRGWVARFLHLSGDRPLGVALMIFERRSTRRGQRQDAEFDQAPRHWREIRAAGQ